MWSCPTEGRAVGGPPRKYCIQVTWRVRDRPPSPIDLWLQGMTACFLVSSLLFTSTCKCACICLCVCVAGSGEKARTPRLRPQCFTPVLCHCANGIQTHTFGLSLRHNYTGSSQSTVFIRVWGGPCLLLTKKEPFPFSTPFFPINSNRFIQGAGGIAG